MEGMWLSLKGMCPVTQRRGPLPPTCLCLAFFSRESGLAYCPIVWLALIRVTEPFAQFASFLDILYQCMYFSLHGRMCFCFGSRVDLLGIVIWVVAWEYRGSKLKELSTSVPTPATQPCQRALFRSIEDQHRSKEVLLILLPSSLWKVTLSLTITAWSRGEEPEGGDGHFKWGHATAIWAASRCQYQIQLPPGEWFSSDFYPLLGAPSFLSLTCGVGLDFFLGNSWIWWVSQLLKDKCLEVPVHVPFFFHAYFIMAVQGGDYHGVLGFPVYVLHSLLALGLSALSEGSSSWLTGDGMFTRVSSLHLVRDRVFLSFLISF